MLSFNVENPKELSDMEFNSIGGSTLHSRMVKNRCIVTCDMESASDKHSIHKKIVDFLKNWLANNATGMFYVSTPSGGYRTYVYLEKSNDAVMLKLTIQGEELKTFITLPPPLVPPPLVHPPRPTPRAPRPPPPTLSKKTRDLVKEMIEQNKWLQIAEDQKTGDPKLRY